jgi:hypothetical protein
MTIGNNTARLVSRAIFLWMISVVVSLILLLKNNELLGDGMYNVGPNDNLYILGFCINNTSKYSVVIVFCFINSGVRTLNNEIVKPWIVNQVQDVSKTCIVPKIDAYELSCVSGVYSWFDFFMYMNILLSQIDMMLVEVFSDLLMTLILTNYYVNRIAV